MTDHRTRQLSLPYAGGAADFFDEPVVVTVADGGTAVASISRCDHTIGGRPGDCLTAIAVAGDVDSDTAPVLGRALWRALAGPHPVCCDLSRVTFFGAAAARTVLGANDFAERLGRVFFLRGVHGGTDRVLGVVDPGGLVRR